MSGDEVGIVRANSMRGFFLGKYKIFIGTIAIYRRSLTIRSVCMKYGIVVLYRIEFDDFW